MAINASKKGFTQHSKPLSAGFTLLVSVIFMTVLLSIGLTLGSLGYKQTVLASSATESQYAFYAADAALECALYDDTEDPNDPGNNTQGDALPFAYDNPSNNPGFACGTTFSLNAHNSNSSQALPATHICKNAAACPFMKVTYFRIPVFYKDPTDLQVDTETACADVTAYDQDPAHFPSPRHTWIFTQGYNVPCNKLSDPNIRITARGLQADVLK